MTPAKPRSDWSWLLPVSATALLLQVTFVNFWPGFPSPNERGRAYQALAIVHRGSLSINEELIRFGAMEDVARHGDRLFPNKAPGLLPLLVPAAWLARAFAGEAPSRELAFTLVLGRLLASSLPLLLTVLLLYRACAAWPNGRPLAIAAVALGSPLLTASLLLFSHALSALLLFAAGILLRRPRDAFAPALAGLLLAWSFTAEYPTAVPAAVLLLCALRGLGARGVALTALGAAPVLFGLAAYNSACFGSFLALSSGHEAYPAFARLTATGVFGIGWPTPAGLGEMLLSPARGVIIWVPLVLVAVGVWGLSPAERRDVLPGLMALLASVVVMAGYPNRHGGWFAGPRYLVHALPLAAPALAAVLHRFGARPAVAAVAGSASLWGMAATWLCVVTFPFPPEDFPLPWVTLAPGLLRDGLLAPSWAPPALAAALLAGLGLASLALTLTAVPRPGRAAAALIATLALTAAWQIRPPAAFTARLEAAVIHDVYLGARGGLERLAARTADPGQRGVIAGWMTRRDAAAATTAP